MGYQMTDEEFMEWDELRRAETPYDPTQPPHPLFNPAPQPERTGCEVMLASERVKYMFEWHSAIERIKNRQFATRHALADFYRKSYRWACDMVRLMVKQHVFTEAELRDLLPRERKASVTNRSVAQQGSSAVRRKETKARWKAKLDRMTAAEVEDVLHQRDTTLTIPLVVAMLLGRSFKSVTGFAEHFERSSYWGHAVSRCLEREGFLQPGEFRTCFSDRRRSWHRQHHANQTTTTHPAATPSDRPMTNPA